MQALTLTPTKTPERITPSILSGCARLVPGASPVFVPREPVAGARINKCTYNVRQFLEEHSGEMVLGWDVCVWDNVMLDCIGHAVVGSEGQLRCVTPSKYGEAELLFLPDPALTFDFDNPMARMPTTQVALSGRPEVKRLIEVEEAEHAIKTKYPVSSEEIVVRGEDAVVLQKLAKEKSVLMLKVLLATSDHTTRCFCGSGKKFRKCHRPNVEHMLRLA